MMNDIMLFGNFKTRLGDGFVGILKYIGHGSRKFAETYFLRMILMEFH